MITVGGLDAAKVTQQELSARGPCLHQEAVTLQQLLLFYLRVLHQKVTWF